MPEPARKLGFRLGPVLAVVAGVSLLTAAGPVTAQDGSYRKALRAWAQDPGAQPVLDLVKFEQENGSDVSSLRSHERKNLVRLVERERLGSIAAAVLHQVAFRVHAKSGYRDLVTHSMEMSDWALALALRSEKSIPEVREAAAILNTAMALALREHRFVDAAALRLERAIELDPGLTIAYEWGASAEEQQGRLGRARKLLHRLIALEPDHVAARLRLAMVSMKLGDPAAVEMLEAVVAADHRSSWVEIVAVQELAQAYARAGRREEAIGVLRRATAEFPEDQGLAIALAFLDRAHRRPSRALLESMATRGALDSARVIYGGWEPLEPLVQKVEAILKVHLPRLTRALDLTDPRR